MIKISEDGALRASESIIGKHYITKSTTFSAKFWQNLLLLVSSEAENLIFIAKYLFEAKIVHCGKESLGTPSSANLN